MYTFNVKDKYQKLKTLKIDSLGRIILCSVFEQKCVVIFDLKTKDVVSIKD